ncbi:MAG TPA: UvrD-helicase domain-containing protein [Sulfuricella sp.]|nr:UvrD-helicase domain-containing protein [Sulfuricella sp.]
MDFRVIYQDGSLGTIIDENPAMDEYTICFDDGVVSAQPRHTFKPDEEYLSYIEAKRQDLINKLRRRFQDNFLNADALFNQPEFLALISPEEYEQEKSLFIQNWIKQLPKGSDGKKATVPDAEQAAAIASTGGHIQVIARAGSGKTETIANRVVFLHKHCNVALGQMLLLAFNRKAAKEMRERLTGKLGEGNVPHIMTFHALALAIIPPEQNRDLLTNDAEGESQGLNRVFQDVIDGYLKDDASQQRIRRLMLAHFKEDWERIIEGGYNLGQEEKLRFRRNLARETLRGEYVKSYGEKAIANFLLEHGISYQYERNHWWSGLNYRPDFTIPPDKPEKRGIIIEYFGLIGDPDYDEQIKLKREYWESKKQDWVLLEYTPNDLANGTEGFEQRLQTELKKLLGTCDKLSEDEIWQLTKKRAIGRFTTAMTGFVGRCRKDWILPDKLAEKVAVHTPLSDVESWFLELACELYTGYLDRLEATNQEDFDGLMQRAAMQVDAGETQFARKAGAGDLRDLRYIFVDEYQDFTELFQRLVEAIRKHNSTAEFFCVGDDWQAINGYAGSDLKFYKNFATYFGESKQRDISKNYRSVRSVVEVGNALMDTLGKPATTDNQDMGGVLVADLKQFMPTLLEEQKFKSGLLTPVILRIVGKVLFETKMNVALLNHANHLFVPSGGRKHIDDYLNLLRNELPEEWRDRVTISTAHRFKGNECDVVIVMDAFERSYPLIHPNWVFARILGESYQEIEAEDRRLFYVALTRARQKLVIITEAGRVSPFLQDIQRHIRIPDVNWDDYPPLPAKTRWLVVKVGGSMDVNMSLKAEGYQFRNLQQRASNGQFGGSNLKSWDKSFLREGFSIQTLQSSGWAINAKQELRCRLSVRVHDDRNQPLAEYEVHAGQWFCVMDKLNAD